LSAEHALIGREVGEPLDGYRLPGGHPFARAGRAAADQDAAPFAEPYADLEYRRHVIAVLVGRVLCQAAEDQRSRAAALTGDLR
jgi:carbon-monoxide dehydrogenase medium subunit